MPTKADPTNHTDSIISDIFKKPLTGKDLRKQIPINDEYEIITPNNVDTSKWTPSSKYNNMVDIIKQDVELHEFVKQSVTNEDNTIFNTNFYNEKDRLIIINLEDDTFLPVLNLQDKYLEIIKELYIKCNLIFDYEIIDILIPDTITNNNIKEYFYELINSSNKTIFIEKYIPSIISKILLDRNINLLKKDFKLKENNIVNKILDYKSYTDLNIKIPNNIIKKKDIKDNDNLLENYGFSYHNTTEIVAFNYYITNSENDKIIKQTEIEFVIILNYNNLITIVLENPSLDEKDIYTKATEFGFINLFSIKTDNKQIINFITKNFYLSQFDNIDEINTHLQILSQYFDLYSNKTDDEETEVSDFLKTYYIIDTDPNNKIKFSELYNTITTTPIINLNKLTLSNFKNRLSKYLKNLGLDKKRYQDGYYYYGLKKKANRELIQTYQEECEIRKKEMETNNIMEEFEKIIKERII